MHEDKFLYSRYGKANHFKVPEGYFDGLDQRVMQALSRDDQRALQPDEKETGRGVECIGAGSFQVGGIAPDYYKCGSRYLRGGVGVGCLSQA